jgi:glyoxylase-like metal-dependent hydrolase (beta-lactamase superfamily II)
MHAIDEPRFELSRWSVTRVTERRIDSFTPAFLYPDWERDLLSAHAGRLRSSFDDTFEHVRLSVHTWVLRTARRTVLIDTCIGNHKERPGKTVFHQLDTPFLERLRAAGVDPAEVDLVINTHLHTDHVGWNTRLVDGRWVPTFPNARYVFPAHELQLIQAHEGHLAQVYADSVLPVLWSEAQTVPASGADLGDGLSMVATPGHTLGHMSVWLEADGQFGFFSGDVMHHPLQVLRPAWNSVFCDAAEQARATRERVLAEVAELDAVYFSSHFPGDSLGRIRRDGSGFAWEFLGLAHQRVGREVGVAE